ncbi:hypothetical protein NC77_08465 [Janthinobacterium lividum]|nr:hypothetical protein NC77_08465 [Janthinobacterium lividum]
MSELVYFEKAIEALSSRKFAGYFCKMRLRRLNDGRGAHQADILALPRHLLVSKVLFTYQDFVF